MPLFQAAGKPCLLKAAFTIAALLQEMTLMTTLGLMMLATLMLGQLALHHMPIMLQHLISRAHSRALGVSPHHQEVSNLLRF